MTLCFQFVSAAASAAATIFVSHIKPRSHCADLAVPISTIWKIWKPVRQSFTVKLCRVGRDCGYYLFIDRFKSCVESETSWDCRTQCEGIRGQRVGIRGQRTDGREDWINITIASCIIGVTFTFSYISIYMRIYLCIYVYILTIWVYIHDLRATVPC